MQQHIQENCQPNAEIAPSRTTNITWEHLKECLESPISFPNANHRVKYNLEQQDVQYLYGIWKRLPKIEERTPQYLSYRWSLLMTKCMDIPKIPGPIYPTPIDRKLLSFREAQGLLSSHQLMEYGGVIIRYRG